MPIIETLSGLGTFLGGVGSIGGPLYGSAASARGQSEANAATAQMVREQMAFQERMDSTKYQRGVADARAAGFNPLVAFPGSGGSPIGASAVMQNTQPNKGELYLSTARALTDLANMKADVKLKSEQVETEKSKQELNRAQGNLANANAGGSFGLPGLLNVPLNSSTASNWKSSLQGAGGALMNWFRSGGRSFGDR